MKISKKDLSVEEILTNEKIEMRVILKKLRHENFLLINVVSVC